VTRAGGPSGYAAHLEAREGWEAADELEELVRAPNDVVQREGVDSGEERKHRVPIFGPGRECIPVHSVPAERVHALEAPEMAGVAALLCAAGDLAALAQGQLPDRPRQPVQPSKRVENVKEMLVAVDDDLAEEARPD
jgi:hypothetical protein